MLTANQTMMVVLQLDNGGIGIIVKDFCFSDNISGKTIYKIAKSNRKHEH